jgi:membrane-associated phospholipid phosphatase
MRRMSQTTAPNPEVRRGLVAMAGVAVAFGALVALVVSGALTGADQYSVDHLMPAIEPGDMGSAPLFGVDQLYPHPHASRPLDAICDLWTYPASPLISALVLVACCVVLIRRGRRSTALAFAVAWIVVNAVEVFGKRVLERPPLTVPGRGTLGFFENSFPSGHSTRAVLTAAGVAIVWPRLAVPAFLWAAGVLPALVILGAHTPSDVLGGALLGVLAVLAVETWLRANAAIERDRFPSPGYAVTQDP